MFLKLSFLSQPYREIFEFFIDNFKTYKPLLSAIKNEYEATLGKLLDFDLWGENTNGDVVLHSQLHIGYIYRMNILNIYIK